jgi:hypothetical protein
VGAVIKEDLVEALLRPICILDLGMPKIVEVLIVGTRAIRQKSDDIE